MEYLTISKLGGPGSGFHVEGFPGAVKVATLRGPKARRLAHLALHLNDLLSAERCLTALAKGQVEPVRSALWFTAVVEYMKCFGKSQARFSLVSDVMYAGNPLATDAFAFFKAMRHKHYVHDENAFGQALPGAVINGPQCPHKIAKIVTLAARGDIVSQENFTNLSLLVERAQEWVTCQYDELCDSITADLECLSHDELLALADVEYQKPVLDDVGIIRREP